MFKHYTTALLLALTSSLGWAQCEATALVSVSTDDFWTSELTITYSSDGGEDVVASGFSNGGGTFWTEGLASGEYSFNIADNVYNDGTSGNPLFISIDGTVVDTIPAIPGGAVGNSVSFDLSVTAVAQDVPGCTDETATNYDECATIDDGSCTNLDYVTIVLQDIVSPFSMSCDGWVTSAGFGGFVFQGDSTAYNASDCNNNQLSFDLYLEEGCYEGLIVLPQWGTEASWFAYTSNGDLINSGAGLTGAFEETFAFYVGAPACLNIGCTDDQACDYNPAANFPGECTDYTSCAGCIDEGACNYDSTLTIQAPGSCDYTCVGCLDSTALNFCSDCTIDDAESCLYCEGIYYSFEITDSYGDGLGGSLWGGVDGSALVSTGDSTYLAISGDWADPDPSLSASVEFCVAADACVYVEVNTDQYPGETDFSLTNLGTGEVLWDDSDGLAVYTTYTYTSASCVLGCTDAIACNYAAAADINDGSCDYSCIGCQDSDAANFDPNATLACADCCVFCDPGTFIMTFEATDAGLDGWSSVYNLYAVDGDGSSLLSGTVTAEDEGMSLANVCLLPGCYYIQTTPDVDPDENSLVVTDEFGTTYPAIGANEFYNLDFGTNACGFEGCTDSAALNYDPSASVDDNSCYYPPINDTAGDASDLTCGLSVQGSLLYAQDVEGLAGTQFGNSTLQDGSVWYQINSDANQAISVSTCDTPDNVDQTTDWATDTEIAILVEDADGNLSIIATNGAGCEASAHSTIQFYAMAGSDYLIRVTGTGGNDFALSASCDPDAATPPSNDDCANALVVPNGESVVANLCGSQAEEISLGWSSPATSYAQWFAFNSQDFDGFYFSGSNLNEQEGSNIGVALLLGNTCETASAYLGGVVTGTIAGPTTDFGLELEPNSNYYFVIWTEDPDVCGDAELFVEGIYQGCTDPVALNYDPQANEEDYSCDFGDNVPANDECEGAIALVCDSTFTGSTGNASSIGAPDACETFAGPGVWYMFEGDSSLVTLDLCGSAVDSKLTVVRADTACGGAYVDAPPVDPCDTLVTVNWTLGGGSWFSETSFYVYDASGAQVFAGGGSFTVPTPGPSGSACLAPGDYTVDCIDDYGDGWNGNVLNLSNNLGAAIGSFANASDAAAGEAQTFTFSVAPYSTEPITYPGDYECVALSTSGDLCDGFNADDASAQFVTDNGSIYYAYVQSQDQDGSAFTDESGAFSLSFSCEVPVYGCQDPVACNYVAEANVATDCDYFSCLCPDTTGVALEFDMYSGYWLDQEQIGIGWYGGAYTITSFEDGAVVASGSLDDAATATDADNYIGNDEGSDFFCLAPGCYSIEVTGGDYPSAIGWDLRLADGTSLAGGAPPTAWWSSSYTGVGTFTVTIGDAVCGCTDSGACNYNADATNDDGSCEYLTCAGCTDQSACNYDATATIDDLSQCCYDNCISITKTDYYNDGWDGGGEYRLSTIDGELIGQATLGFGNNGEVDTYCVADGCYMLEWLGDNTYDNEVQMELTGAFGQVIIMGCGSLSSDCPNEDYPPITFNVGSGAECVYGCQVPQACNYNENANTGGIEACVFDGCSGCTYEEATEATYDPTALFDDGSCLFEIANPCPADLNGDGSVSTADLLEFLTAFGSSC